MRSRPVIERVIDDAVARPCQTPTVVHGHAPETPTASNGMAYRPRHARHGMMFGWQVSPVAAKAGIWLAVFAMTAFLNSFVRPADEDVPALTHEGGRLFSIWAHWDSVALPRDRTRRLRELLPERSSGLLPALSGPDRRPGSRPRLPVRRRRRVDLAAHGRPRGGCRAADRPPPTRP